MIIHHSSGSTAVDDGDGGDDALTVAIDRRYRDGLSCGGAAAMPRALRAGFQSVAAGVSEREAFMMMIVIIGI